MTHHAPLPDGKLVENIVHFARALRKAGVKVGSGQVETAIRAIDRLGFSHRIDFYHILRATLITRADHLEVFHQVFSMFWRDPEFLESLMHMLSPLLQDDAPPPDPGAAQRRAEDAMGAPPKKREQKPAEELIQQSLLTWSDTEIIKRKDFEQMSAAELAEAEQAVRLLNLSVKPLRTRRNKPSRYGARPDARATLRAARKRGGEIQEIARRSQRVRPPDLIALCDISGSMSVYSRMVLHFLHAVAHAPTRQFGHVHAFTFGTRLTNVTRALRMNDPDIAMGLIGREAKDWEGGTRIGAALEKFNKDWSRRVLGSGAFVLLITDGLERGDIDLLECEAARLSRSAKKVILLNPLLRWDGFAPHARGITTLLEHVDSMHGCHSLDSFQTLSETLGQPDLRDRFLTQSRRGSMQSEKNY